MPSTRRFGLIASASDNDKFAKWFSRLSEREQLEWCERQWEAWATRPPSTDEKVQLTGLDLEDTLYRIRRKQ